MLGRFADCPGSHSERHGTAEHLPCESSLASRRICSAWRVQVCTRIAGWRAARAPLRRVPDAEIGMVHDERRGFLWIAMWPYRRSDGRGRRLPRPLDQTLSKKRLAHERPLATQFSATAAITGLLAPASLAAISRARAAPSRVVLTCCHVLPICMEATSRSPRLCPAPGLIELLGPIRSPATASLMLMNGSACWAADPTERGPISSPQLFQSRRCSRGAG